MGWDEFHTVGDDITTRLLVQGAQKCWPGPSRSELRTSASGRREVTFSRHLM